MRNAILAIEIIGLAKDDVLGVRLYSALHPLCSLKPDQLDLAGIVYEARHKPPATACALHVKVVDLAPQLDVLGIKIDITDLMDHRPVDIAEWVIVNEIAIGAYLEFLSHQFSPLRAYAFQVFNGSGEEG
jgi:hypothetical protein